VKVNTPWPNYEILPLNFTPLNNDLSNCVITSSYTSSYMIIINRIQILNKYGRHTFNMSPKISTSLELLKKDCKSFCIQISIQMFWKNSKIFHFMKSNELKIWEMILDIIFHISPNFHIDLSLHVSAVILQSWQWYKIYIEKILKQIFGLKKI